MGQQYSHLSSEERILIEKLHCEQHLSVLKIAEEIGRDKSTVSRELRRGLWFASNENGSYRPYRPKRLKTGPWTSGPFYSALAAQRKADLRRRGSRKPRRMDSDRLRAWVLDSLRRGWSPELIEGRLKAQYAGDPSMRISHECLCQWIYAKPQRALDLRQYLARGRKRRTRKKGRKAKGPRIPMRVPIADRPEAVGSRKGFGHFESDTVVGAAPSRRCMNTQVERRSRRLFARLVDDKSASATARAEYEIFKDIPPAARVDRTWDNGTEASLHMLVDEALARASASRTTTAPGSPATRACATGWAWTRTSPTRTVPGSVAATRTGTAGSAAICPKEPGSRTWPRRTSTRSSVRSTTPR